MINRVVLIGRLTKDVELRMTSSGTPVCSFTIAVDDRYSNKETNEKSTSFINCVAWSNTAKLLATYVKKGLQVGVEGRLQQRTFETKDGRKGSAVEVICDNVQFLTPKENTNANENSGFSVEESDDQLTYSDEDLPF